MKYTIKINPLFFLIIPIFISGCVSQKEIERACLQTLSAATPVCICSLSTNKAQNSKSVSSPVPSVPINNTATPQEAINPITETPSPESNTIFLADFESGNLSAFSGNDGEFFGKGVFHSEKVVPSPAIGHFSAALTIGSGNSTAAYLFVYKVPSTPLGKYSSDYYIPSNVVPGDWWNVWQWKSVDNVYNKPIISLNILKNDGVLQVVMFYTPGGINTNPTQTITQSNPIPFPTDRWVNLTGNFMSMNDNSGYVTIYQDGVKILEKSNFPSKPGNKDVLWSINSYADKITPNPATIYVDNISIAEVNK